MEACFFQPAVGVSFSNEFQEPTEEGEPVTVAEAEPRGVLGKVVNERPRIIEKPPDGVGNELGDSLGVFVVPEKVGGSSRWSRRGQSRQCHPFASFEGPYVDAYVSSSGLAASWDSELVPVGRKVAKPKKRCGGAV
jgi:hypothetical protein